MKIRSRCKILLPALLAVLGTGPAAAEVNGFDLAGSLIPANEIHLGGPPRDGIPSIDRPHFVAVGEVDFLAAEDAVLGIDYNGMAKAYPIAIMNWHEIVNDRIAGEAVAITYCPLCGTGVAFDAGIEGRDLNFGVSGLLYNSDVLLYDRETESLWSQLAKRAVTGSMKGNKLTALPLTHTTWRAWRRTHPDTLVLSTDTGYRRDYKRDPYGGYGKEQGLYFPVSARSRRYHPKERVLGIEIDGVFKAYPFAELSRAGKSRIEDRVNDLPVVIDFDWANESARAFSASGEQLPAVSGFWFAWYTFHPETEVFTAR